jgi:hypothetical protein
VQVLTQQVNHLHARFAVVLQELQQIFAFYESYLRVIEHFCRNLVWLAGHGSAQAQDFSGPGHTKHQALARIRANREFDPTFAKHKDATGETTFLEDRFPARKLLHRFDGVEGLQRFRWQVAKDAIWAEFAFKTTMMRSAFHADVYLALCSIPTVTLVTNYRDGFERF